MSINAANTALVSLSTVFVLFGQLGCQKMTSSAHSKTGTGIVHGQPLTGHEPFAPAVIGIGTKSGDGYSVFCSGSLIDAHTIVTAGHCFAETSYSEQYVVFGLNEDGEGVQGRKVLRYVVNESYVPGAVDGSKNTYDIAIAHFDGDLPAGYAPANLLTDTTVLKNGADVVLAGYGVDDGSMQMNYGILRYTDVNIMDAAYSDTEIETDETKAGSCNGDSGGPAMIVEDGKYYLWGITSRGDDACVKFGIYTKIAPFQTWITQHLPALNEPVPAPTPEE